MIGMGVDRTRNVLLRDPSRQAWWTFATSAYFVFSSSFLLWVDGPHPSVAKLPPWLLVFLVSFPVV
jgi:hypothetical protein